jgi:hypothetical protein
MVAGGEWYGSGGDEGIGRAILERENGGVLEC